MMFIPDILVKMFTTDKELISISVNAIRLVIIAIPLIGIQIVGATFFQSVGKAIPSLILGMSRQIIFLIPLVLIIPHFLGLKGIFIAFPAADIGVTLITVLWLLKELKTLGLLHLKTKEPVRASLVGEDA